MTNKLNRFIGCVGFLGAVALMGGAGCSSDNKSSTGAGGTTGTAGSLAFHLTGAAEVPATTSTGSADLTVSWDPVMMMVTVGGPFTGLSSNATTAHLHGPADATMSAGVLFAMSNVTAGTSGMVSGSGALSATNWATFLAGMTYLNIHTTDNPGGEIRAQVIPTP
jgi:hypothetical protein